MNWLNPIKDHLLKDNGVAFPIALALLGIVFSLPSLTNGLQTDDWFHRYILMGYDTAHQNPFQMYDWLLLNGDPSQIHDLVNKGVAPWWTDEHLSYLFFRPLSVLTYCFDYRYFPNSPWLMHVHNLLWYGGLLFVATCVFRKLIHPIGIVGLAAFMYALDDAHGFVVGWIANRNSIIATFFGVLSLLFHIRWRLDKWFYGAFLAPFCLALSLLSSEFGLGTCAYLFAYFLFLENENWRPRFLKYLPYGLVLLVWILFYSINQYGVRGSGVYFNLHTDPIGFLSHFWYRAPFLLALQWFHVPFKMIFTFQGLVELAQSYFFLLIVVGSCFIPLLVSSPLARFFAAGMILSLIPITAALSMDRLLLFTGIGAFGLIALGIHDAITIKGKRVPIQLWKMGFGIVMIFLIVIHAVLSPFRYLQKVTAWKSIVSTDEKPYRTLPDQIDCTDKILLLINPVFAQSDMYFHQVMDRVPIPKNTYLLASGIFPLEVKRMDTNTIRVKPTNGYLVTLIDRYFRSVKNPFHIGDRLKFENMDVEIETLTKDGRPFEVAFHFRVPLEDDSLVWLQSDRGKYIPFELPAIGKSKILSLF